MPPHFVYGETLVSSCGEMNMLSCKVTNIISRLMRCSLPMVYRSAIAFKSCTNSTNRQNDSLLSQLTKLENILSHCNKVTEVNQRYTNRLLILSFVPVIPTDKMIPQFLSWVSVELRNPFIRCSLPMMCGWLRL